MVFNMRLKITLAMGMFLSLAVSCQKKVELENTPGTATTYVDPGTTGKVAGIGIESQDIIGMTDKMMRDMLSNPRLAARATPPQVIIDAEYFINEGTSRINKNMITDRLRVELNRAAQGRMVFIGRHYADMVDQERDLKREGVVAPGTKSLAGAPLGADYRLGGRISSLDKLNTKNGMAERYNLIIFEMVDLETSEIVWSGSYEFSKAAQDDIIYR